MELPYTATPTEAFMAAQTSLGAVLTAVVWRRPLRPWIASASMLAAIWIAILAPIGGEIASIVGATFPPGGTLLLCGIAATLATASMAIARPRWLFSIALVGQLALMAAAAYVKDSDAEIASLHVVWFAALIGASMRARFPSERPREPLPLSTPARRRTDLVLFVTAVVLALAVCWFVLDHTCDSADEWAYNFQALVLARFKAFAPVPPCPEAHRNHWVFFYEGRAFSMYLPGWPMVMAPFARIGIPWVTTALSFGALVVGVARLGRRVGGDSAGIVAALCTMLGAAMLENAGSRYCHVFVAATFAWTVEAVCVATEPGHPPRAQWGWGLLLGAATSLSLFTRPSDAGFLCLGAFLVFVHGLVRRRVGWRIVAGAAITFALFGGVALVILRLQLGTWFKTGYSIADKYWWWAKSTYDVPPRDAWKYGLPFMTATYCFWPASPALAAAGLTFSGRRISFMLLLATLGMLGFYCAVTFGRYRDFGYGPRYHLPLVVVMSVGTGAILAPLFDALRTRKLGRDAFAGAPAALAFGAMALGVARIALMMYPFAEHQLHLRSALFRAIERDDPPHSIVTVRQGDTGGGPLLDTQNDPFDPDPNVLILSGDDLRCIRQTYPDRKIYRAKGMAEVTLTPQ